MKSLRAVIDAESIKDYNALKTGMRVRNADGWIGTVESMLPIKQRNMMGFIGQVTVRVDDITECKIKFYFVGQKITSPAGCFKPLSTGLKFSCGEWKQGA